MADQAVAPLHVSGYTLSSGGVFREGRSDQGAYSYACAWDAEKLTLIVAGEGDAADKDEPKKAPAALATLPWLHVTSIWVSLRSLSDSGFKLEVTLETSHPASRTDFLRVVAAMDKRGGEFLSYLQSAQAGRIKDGRAPSFATGRWARPLLAAGWSVRTLRLYLGRIGIVLEIFYSVCFFTQLHSMLLSREAKLAQAFVDLFGDLGQLWEELVQLGGEVLTTPTSVVLLLGVNLPATGARLLWKSALRMSNWIMLVMLMQHLMVVMFMVDGFFRLVGGALKSAMTFHRAATRVQKAVKKSRTREG